jgi:hypothetical protein
MQETIEQFKARGGVVQGEGQKIDPKRVPKSKSQVTAVGEPVLPEGFEDMPHGEIRTRRQAGVSLQEKHHIATRCNKRNRAIFEKLGLSIDDELNLIRDFGEHGYLRGSYDWDKGGYKRFIMKGHHKKYNAWVTRLLTEATPPGLAPDEALSRVTKVLQTLKTLVKKHPDVLALGPEISPVLEHLTFTWD